MLAAKKELSGFFLSPTRFQAAIDELAQPCCPTTSLRLFHNEARHTAALLAALASGNSSIKELDIYELHSGAGAEALQVFLASDTSTCRPTALAVHSCHGNAAAAIGQGLAARSCQVVELSLTGLQDLELAAVLRPLAACMAEADAEGATASPGVGPRALRQLTLLRCGLGANSAQCLLALKCLSHLSLTDCMTSDAVTQQLVQQALSDPPQPGAAATAAHSPVCALKSLALCEPQAAPSHLQSLTLAGSHVGVLTAQTISTLLSQPWCALTQLCLSNSTGLGDTGATLIAAGLAANHSLTSLELCHCSIGPTGAQALATALASHTRLERLALNDNHMGAAGLMATLLVLSVATQGEQQQQQEGEAGPADSTAARGCCPLQRLQLECNGVRGVEFAAWPAGRRLRPTVQALLLGRNQLSDAGVALLQQALGGSSSGSDTSGSNGVSGSGGLLQLDLSCNGIGPTGAATLATLLQQQPTLQELKLYSNRLQDSGAAALVGAVAAHPSLHVFRAESCRVLDLELKGKIMELTQVLAARQHRQAAGSAGGNGSTGTQQQPRQLRVGTRFPPDSYVAQGDAAAPQQPQQVPAGGRAGVRMGSRFPPHVYAMQVTEGGEGDTAQAGAERHQGVTDGAAAPHAGGKHVLGAEERAKDPRACKVHEPGAAGGGGSGGRGGGGGGGGGGGATNPFMDCAWHPTSLGQHGGSGQEGVCVLGVMGSQDVRPNREPHYPERYSLDLPVALCSAMSIDTTTSDPLFSPTGGDTSCSSPGGSCGGQSNNTSPSAAAGSHAARSMALCVGASKSLDLGNRSSTNGAGASGSSSYNAGSHGSSGQSGIQYLVARPSLRKKALTPEQQAFFSVF